MATSLEKYIAPLFFIALFAKLFVQYLLAKRQAKHIHEHRDQVPQEFAAMVTQEQHEKAAAYTLTKLRFGSMSRLLGTLILLLWTKSGGLNFLAQWAQGLTFGPIINNLALFMAFFMIGYPIDFLLSLIQTFVIEERYGMNRSTFKIFMIDQIKGIILGIVLMGILLSALLALIFYGGNYWWIAAFVTMALFQLLIMWAYPTFIAPLFNKFTPLAEGEYKERIENLLQKVGFESKGLFVMDASKRTAHGNAYFTGLKKAKRIVFFDTLLNTLTVSEVEAVLAHELGHFKKKHITKGIIVSLISSFFGFWLFSYLLTWAPFYLGHGVLYPGSELPGVGLILVSLVSGIYTFFLTPVMTYFSRKHEFEADEFAANHAQSQDLVSALVKLYRDNASTLTPDPIYSAFYDSHPPAPVRIAHLKSLKTKEA